MLLRILLIVVAAVAIGLGGCKKDEPKTPQDVASEVEKEAENAKDSDMADEAKEAAEDAAKDAEEAAEGLMK